ncbi:MAG: dihydrodipicolinate synthase family protein [Bryobacter sp.]|nr:dihydrodipicolinate synthase family protein [Bryobacter sp.]
MADELDAHWVSGVWAATLTPRENNGAFAAGGFQKMVEAQAAAGLAGLVVNGATGEYAGTSLGEVHQQMEIVRSSTKLPLVVGVGGARFDQSQALARLAEEQGAVALLLPVPHFFRYGAEDAVANAEALAEATRLPILLYQLPAFTSGYAPEAVMALVEGCPGVRGIKDSSGSLDLLRRLKTEAPAWRRIVGHDGVLVQAIRENLVEGVISGIACGAPELSLAVWQQKPGAADLLEELLRHFEGVPTPWVVKWIVEVRGWFGAQHAAPLGPGRREQKAEFQAWCAGWWNRVKAL